MRIVNHTRYDRKKKPKIIFHRIEKEDVQIIQQRYRIFFVQFSLRHPLIVSMTVSNANLDLGSFFTHYNSNLITNLLTVKSTSLENTTHHQSCRISHKPV